MRKYNLFSYTTLAVAVAFMLMNIATAQYWFQTGVRGANNAGFNNGAGVSIQTVYQNATNGSIGFWVGESLSNGAFIQMGYEITNSTGYYYSSCLNSTTGVYLKAGVPTWFWEYFTADSNNNNDSFCGGIGPNGSAGLNGAFNTYSFKSTGNVWNAYFNDELVGNIDLKTSNSGPNPPSAFAEYADTNTNTWPIKNVTFKNLFFYIGNSTRLVPVGYSAVSYGKGSLTALTNPYGVQEVGNYTNYFVIGSKVPQVQGSVTLWRLGYSLAVYSAYGNLTGSGNYMAYSTVPLAAPGSVNVSNGVRELFTGWVGGGYNSYTGNQTTKYISLYGNVTETATWKRQYYLNATSEYGKLIGNRWYDANGTVTISINSKIITTGAGSRVVFAGWSNNASSNSTTIYLDGPKSVHAIWRRQYYLNATSVYGSTKGSGWYDANSTVNVSLSTTVVPVNQTQQLAFRQWSNGNLTSNIRVVVRSPVSISAVFETQYLVRLVPENSNGENLSNVGYYNISSRRVNSDRVFVFPDTVYNIQYFYYKGVIVVTNYRFNVKEPTTLNFKTPVYDIVINTQSVFGTPVNASLNITFKNNTNIKTYSGDSGNTTFHNVPYGYVTGYAQYFGLKQSVNLAYGVNSYLTFMTASLVALIVGGIAIIVAVAKITAYYESRRTFKAKRRSR